MLNVFIIVCETQYKKVYYSNIAELYEIQSFHRRIVYESVHRYHSIIII